MCPPPTDVATVVTPSSPRMYSSARATRSSVSSMRMPSGNQKSTVNCGRVESGKKLCLSMPKPTSEAANSRTTTPTVAQRAPMQISNPFL